MDFLIFRRKAAGIATKAFTLVELLVAMAVLTLVILVVMRVVDMTSRMTTLAQKRIDADAGARQALDRMGVDLAQVVLRTDLPGRIEKKEGNDRLTIHTQAEGYGGDRGISKIAYECPEGELRRGATGTTWMESDEKPLIFGSGTVGAVGVNDYDIVASDVFRFEIAFLLGDGTIVADVNQLSHRPGSPAAEQVRAVIVGVAALDQKSRLRITDTDLQALSALLGDAVDGQDLLQTWSGALDQSTLPVESRSAVRIYQRFFYLDGQAE